MYLCPLWSAQFSRIYSQTHFHIVHSLKYAAEAAVTAQAHSTQVSTFSTSCSQVLADLCQCWYLFQSEQIHLLQCAVCHPSHPHSHRLLCLITSLTINLCYPQTWNFCTGGRQLQVFLQHCNNNMIGSCKGNLLNVRKYRRPVSYTELWDVHLSNDQQLLPPMILMSTRAPIFFLGSSLRTFVNLLRLPAT